MWSADGRELVFLASAGARQMASVRVSGSGTLVFGTPSQFRASVTGDRRSASPRSFDMLPDGRLIGMVGRGEVDDTNRELRVVLNWFEELKQRVPVSDPDRVRHATHPYTYYMTGPAETRLLAAPRAHRGRPLAAELDHWLEG